MLNLCISLLGHLQGHSPFFSPIYPPECGRGWRGYSAGFGPSSCRPVVMPDSAVNQAHGADRSPPSHGRSRRCPSTTACRRPPPRGRHPPARRPHPRTASVRTPRWHRLGHARGGGLRRGATGGAAPLGDRRGATAAPPPAHRPCLRPALRCSADGVPPRGVRPPRRVRRCHHRRSCRTRTSRSNGHSASPRPPRRATPTAALEKGIMALERDGRREVKERTAKANALLRQ